MISCDAFASRYPTSLWHDEASDKLFVTVCDDPGSLLIFNNASTINSKVTAESSTTSGFAWAISVAYDPGRDIIYVLEEANDPYTILSWDNGSSVSGTANRTITTSYLYDHIVAIAVDPTR
jgi:hypothetical protein